MQPIILSIRSDLARLLRQRVLLLAFMIGASYLIWGALQPTPAAAVVTSSCAVNTDDYYATLPNGFGTIVYNSLSCQTCHTSAPTRGVFGAAYEVRPLKAFADGSWAHQWDSTLAFQDSDGDGYTNGEELQDPSGGWAFGAAAPGNAALVTSPNDGASLPAQPTLSGLSGASPGGSYSDQVNLSISFGAPIDTLGARKVVYDIMSGSTVVKSYTKQTTATAGGYTASAATFNLAWDSNDVPNASYSIRATLSDARAAGARTSTQTVANVTVNNPARTLRYVAAGGSDTGNTCTNSAAPCATIDQAVSQAQNNDEIRVAGGTYTPGNGTSPLFITTRVKLIGGYSTGNWITSDRIANPTILDGQGQRTVLVFWFGSAGFTLQNVTIQHGSGDYGGGVLLYGVTGTIANDIFDSNQVNFDGGAVYLLAGSDGAVIQNVTFLNNSAGNHGGALLSQANFSASNLLFASNSAANGGSALSTESASSGMVSYATIAGSGSAEAILLNGASLLTLNDTLISGYSKGVNVGASASLTLNKVLIANDGANNVAAPTSGAGTVSGAPIRGLAGYKNAAAGDYHLAFGAPAIDAGVAVANITTDLDGLTRPFTTPLPNIVLTPPDIGAYEYSSPYGILYFLTANQQVTLPASVAHVQINLTAPSISPVTVHYATQDSDAKAGVDYTAMSGTLTFPAGESDVIFDIPILATNIKIARSFTVNLSSPTVAQLNIVQSMMVTINPPDLAGPPRVILTASAPNASRNGQIPGVFTLTRDVLIDTALTVHYTVGGSAVAGVDYVALPGSVTFQPGQSEVSIKVMPIGGSGDKLLTLTLTPSPDYLLGRSSATVDISGILSWRVSMPLLRH